MVILAHRGNLQGPVSHSENSIESCDSALAAGFGLEVDIRLHEGNLYVSHDRTVPSVNQFAINHVVVWRKHADKLIAINVKELGYEDQLVDFLNREHVLNMVFVFDMELLEAEPGTTAAKFRSLDDGLKIAARVSDRGESVERALGISAAEIIWLDEFESLWASEAVVSSLKDKGKQVFAVSPELHGFPLHLVRKRWLDFRNWGVDGICTDFPIELTKSLGLRS